MKRFEERLLEYQNQWFFEREGGQEVWKEVKKQYSDEMRRLDERATSRALAALPRC